MKPAHRHALSLKLDQLWYEGWVKFDRWELLAFFERQRVTNAVWSQINEMWADRHSENDVVEELAYVTVRSEENVTTPHAFLLINKSQLHDIE
ncbi:MAG: hypothetical protein BWK73_31895 [Thiothrix lacustris]|uniref:Uncharacterized protein n=1 Tax=Thiothrix lacustris TaxID=525917 RepID=A0A1Y1QIC7_9GAMM|nr:MAG: hypothetical protein BWK73_31895 [Thiothrix lacustris]